MNEPQVHQAVARSTFVTVIAWIFIVLGGFSTVISILQNVMLTTMMPPGGPVAGTRGSENVPPFALFMMENFRLVFAGFMVVSILTLASAVGLLRRWNWARWVFIGLMALGIAWQLGGTIMMFSMVSSFGPPAAAPAEFRAQHEMMTRVMVGFTLFMALGFAVLFGWIIKRLMAVEIRREFAAR
jgi:hypothetical protein